MILIIILTCIILTCIYVIINLVRKNDRLDDEIDEANLYAIDILNDLQKLQEDMDDVYDRLDEYEEKIEELERLVADLRVEVAKKRNK